jgi:hypothetical protein
MLDVPRQPTSKARRETFAGKKAPSAGEGCSSGAAINYNGARYMLTAAHCYQPGWSIYNAFQGQAGPYMGYEASRDSTMQRRRLLRRVEVTGAGV